MASSCKEEKKGWAIFIPFGRRIFPDTQRSLNDDEGEKTERQYPKLGVCGVTLVWNKTLNGRARLRMEMGWEEIVCLFTAYNDDMTA